MTDVMDRGASTSEAGAMKAAACTIPVLLSALVLAAHFYRMGNVGFVAFVLVLPLLLITRERWAVRVVQIGLLLAAAEWIRTAVTIAQIRAASGAPTTRMFVILGGVAAFTALSALPLKRLAER